MTAGLFLVGCTCTPPVTPPADSGVDLCKNVSCASPPGLSPCFAKFGTCDAGQCTYAFVDDVPCNDGEDCTGPDVCKSGVCVSAPIVCNDPPLRVCAGAAYTAYADAGTCVGGTCVYASTPVACTDGVCDGRACGGACVDLSNDPRNCGACGNACLAGSCAVGTCSLTAVQGAVHPWVAVDETGLYWSAIGNDGGGGVIARLPPDGGAAQTLVQLQAPLRPWALALGPDGIYFVAFGSDGGAVFGVPKDGGPAVVLADEWSPQGIAVDGDRVYWAACESTSSNPARRRIASVGIAGGPVSVIASTPFCPQRVAVDADAVYWSELGVDAGLMRAPRDGGAVERLAETNNTLASIIERLVAGKSELWWLSAGGGLVAIPKAGGAPVFTAGSTGAVGVAGDVGYFLSSMASPGTLHLFKRPTDGGAPEMGRAVPGLGAATVSSCTGLAVGANSLFAACGEGMQWRLVQLAQ